MKYIILWQAILLAVLTSSAHARFSEFVCVAPGIEQERVSMPYSICTDPILTITPSSNQLYTIKIPVKESRQHQQYWVIRCDSSLTKEEQMNFRNDILAYEYHKRRLREIEQSERFSPETKSILIKKLGELKSRDDIETIEPLSISNDTANIVLKIPESEIERTYLYRDYQNRVMDGGYYYCFDLPAYYRKFQVESVPFRL